MRAMALLGLVAVAALGSACVRAQPLYCSRWLDITTCQSPSGIGRHGLAQTGEAPELRHATSFGRDAQAAPWVRSWRGGPLAQSRPIFYSLPRRRCYAGHGVDRPASRHAGLRSRFHVPSVQHGSAAMPMPLRPVDQASALAPWARPENWPRSWCPTWSAIRG